MICNVTEISKRRLIQIVFEIWPWGTSIQNKMLLQLVQTGKRIFSIFLNPLLDKSDQNAIVKMPFQMKHSPKMLDITPFAKQFRPLI